MKKFLDLRCSRRLTLEEGLALLNEIPGEMSPAAEDARTKILLAIRLATHICPPAVLCPVCGGKNAMQRRLRERAAVQRLKKAPEREKVAREVKAASRRAALESKPKVSFIDPTMYLPPCDVERWPGGAA